MTKYHTSAVDLRRQRSLIVYGGPDLNAEQLATIKGWAVREWATGQLHLLGERVNGCLPFQGGGGMDGFWLLQAWVTPSSTCWLDWNVYDRGDLANFVTPHKTGKGKAGAGALHRLS